MGTFNPFDDLNKAREEQQRQMRPKDVVKLEIWKTYMQFLARPDLTLGGLSLEEYGQRVMDHAEDLVQIFFKDKTKS